MDYGFYGTSQQPYHYLGMPANAYANAGIDPEAMRSVVSASVRLQFFVAAAAPLASKD
jgi:hypothetical protein